MKETRIELENGDNIHLQEVSDGIRMSGEAASAGSGWRQDMSLMKAVELSMALSGMSVSTAENRKGKGTRFMDFLRLKGGSEE